jgi:hypothetical protein
MSSIRAPAALALALLPGAAQAQHSKVLLRVGDPIAGAGTITKIQSIDVDSVGNWTALVQTDDPVAHTVLFVWGRPHVKVGDSPPNLAGASIAGLEPPTWDLFEIPAFIARLSGSTSAQAVMRDLAAQLLTGQPATTYTNQLPLGSTWRRFDDVQFAWADAGYLLRGAIDDPAGGALDLSFAAVVSESYMGVLGWIDVVALEGQLAPGLARTIEDVRSAPAQACVSQAAGKIVWSCDLDGSANDDGCVYFTQVWPGNFSTLLAREGSPSPVAGRAWGSLEDHAVDLNASASWTLRARLDASDPSNDEVLVNDSTVIAREGDVLPATAPYALASLGQGRGALDQNGRVLWFGAWDDPSTPGADEALFQDEIAVLRTGQTGIAGSVVVDLDDGPRSFSLDPSHGRYVAFVGDLADGTRGAFLLDLAAVEPYCTAKPNSFGVEPALKWSGQPPSASIGSGFQIQASSLAVGVPAVFFYGTDGPLAQPFHGGTLCVQPPLQRAKPQITLGTTGASGFASMDFNSWIASGVDPRLVAGRRVNLQLWYRDPGFAPPDDIGLTSALEFRIGP